MNISGIFWPTLLLQIAGKKNPEYYCRYFTEKARQKKDVGENISETESVSDSEFDTILGKYQYYTIIAFL